MSLKALVEQGEINIAKAAKRAEQRAAKKAKEPRVISTDDPKFFIASMGLAHVEGKGALVVGRIKKSDPTLQAAIAKAQAAAKGQD